jgi:beta-glucosidase
MPVMAATAAVVMMLPAAFASPAGAALAGPAGPARPAGQGSGSHQPNNNDPYTLPVRLPRGIVASPAVDPAAPYTRVVKSLIAQLLPDNPPTAAELANASKIMVYGRGINGCWGTGPVEAPVGTTPSIEQLCWADAQGVLLTSGAIQHGTTAPMTLMGLGSSFDTSLGNVWGQTAGKEARWYMVTGIYGPQGDINVLPNWGRNLTTTGEDPFLSQNMVASQVNGMQGAGAMSQMKHFAIYNGQNGNTTYQDQALHEVLLAPYEGGYVQGQAAAAMCSYQASQDLSAYLPSSVPSLWPASPYATGTGPQTWPLGEMHFSCEQPQLIDNVLRQQWHSLAMVATDYGAMHSTSAIFQGTDQEMPTRNFYYTTNPYGANGSPFSAPASGFDATGSMCADPASGNQVSCGAAGAVHVSGIPSGPACPLDATNGGGCSLVNAVLAGTVPLSLFKQSLARILYQEQRFGLLGCSSTPVSPLCTNPGGNGAQGGDAPGTGTRTGQVLLPDGPSSGAPVLGTKNGDAAIVEKYSEEGAVLLQNDNQALPITSSDLHGGILVTGANANHTVADPTREASTGFVDRNAVNPLQQLKAFSGKPDAFTYVPAGDPTGQPVPSSALSTSTASVTGSLARTTGPGAPSTDPTIDFTTVSGHGQLAPGSYTWSGNVYVPATDTYTFDFQQSSAVPNANVTFTFDGTPQNLSTASNVYGSTVPGSPTNAGYTEALLVNRQFAAGSLPGGSYHPVTITFNNTSPGPASFRFAYTRTNGDIADAAAAAVGKKLAVVFVNDGIGATSTIPNPYGTGTISAPISLSADSTNLINAVAAANPNTVVVLNTANPVLTPWRNNVKSVLEMWFAGQEGGTSTARLLLGLANPSGHTSLTWPAGATDTIWGYNETTPLYPGDTTGPHPERIGSGGGGPAGGGSASFTQGIYSGYRFFDKEGITPAFAFGTGLSYTRFRWSDLHLKPTDDGGINVSFDVTNTGQVTGTVVPQVYVGAAADVPARIQQAVRSLRGFQRVNLAAGQTRHVTIKLDARSFQYWDEVHQQWTTATSNRTIWVGDGDALSHLPLSGIGAPNADHGR